MSSLQEIIPVITAAVSLGVAASAIAAALKSGILKRIKFGSFEIEASQQDREEVRRLIAAVSHTKVEEIPFETEQLALYYRQVLSQSKISFWFSLIFASLGFAVIVTAGFLYTGTNTGATVAQFIAGLVMDAVAALFFTQSRSAQKAMSEFFDKLRRDRQHLESRRLCESISNPLLQDVLRLQLALHYAEIEDSSSVTKTLIDSSVESISQKMKIVEKAVDGNPH